MKNKPQVVFDTNILVSRLLLPKSKPSIAVDWGIRNAILLMSATTLGELTQVLSRKKFDRYVSIENRKKFIMNLGRFITMVSTLKKTDLCRDPKDNAILEVALNGRADAIVTGDDDLKVLKNAFGVPIYSPDEFITKYSIKP